jgi:hypothetical protein
MAESTTKNCWDYFECSRKFRKDCPAYENNMGRECWYMNNTSKGCVVANKKGISSCFDCPWYKTLNPGGLILKFLN